MRIALAPEEVCSALTWSRGALGRDCTHVLSGLCERHARTESDGGYDACQGRTRRVTGGSPTGRGVREVSYAAGTRAGMRCSARSGGVNAVQSRITLRYLKSNTKVI